MDKMMNIRANLLAKRLSVVLCSGLLLLASCLPGECAQEKENQRQEVLVIGLIPEQNVFRQLERYTPLTEYLSRKTGRKIKLKILARYGNIIRNFDSSGMDGAFFGSFTYALAHKALGVEVLARPQGLDGASTYHGLIFVRKDSGITDSRGMKGKRFVFVDKATTAGYLLPLVYLKEHGVDNYRTYFKETYFAGTHEDAINDVLDKKADAGAAKNTIFERLAATNAGIREQLRILARSPDVPENGLALRAGLPASIKTALRDALLNMHLDPAGQTILKNFGAQKFIPTANRDYESVFRYAREIGLDLAHYDYMNH